MKKIGIIGAGASGLYAALNLVNENTDITILEKNDSIGKKLLMTGNGRCNITNAKYYDDFLENIVRNKKFIYSSFSRHDNYGTMDFFESSGLSLVTEENERVFPKSQSAKDVVKFFENKLMERNIRVVTQALVTDIRKNRNFKVYTAEKIYEFDYLIIATGGLSYPATGSSGDGYKFGKGLGHKISKTYPALVPIFFKDTDLSHIKALSLDNIKISVSTNDGKFSQEGPVLLTKNFLSGPSVLSLSSFIVDKNPNDISLDLYGVDLEVLDKELIEAFDKNPNKDIGNILKEIIPQSLVEVVLKRSGLRNDKKAEQVKRSERLEIVKNIKDFRLSFDKFGGYKAATITRGGVDVDDINPKTMESKLVDKLYFIGEVLDIDALTGGYNLQLAFSTAFAAASAIKETL